MGLQTVSPETFHVIWASAPCTEYSRAKTTGMRKLEYANSVVKRTIEIIGYFQPKVFFMENPQTELLKQQDFMPDFDFFDVNYCKYGFPYRKRTRIWTNLKTWKPPEDPEIEKNQSSWEIDTATRLVLMG